MLVLSNINLASVLLAYDEEAVSGFLKDAMGWGFCSRVLGEQVYQYLVSASQIGKIKPFVGETIGFEDIPRAIDAMAN